MADQVQRGLRPLQDTIQKLFWAPGPQGEDWHWQRAVTTRNSPSLCQCLSHRHTLKEIYAVLRIMPLGLEGKQRGSHSAEKGRAKLQRHVAIRKEVKTFCQSLGMPSLPQDPAEWRTLCQEMGTFLAAKTFLTHCPPQTWTWVPCF